MPRLFGTDGIRGVANKDLTPDLALALGRAAGSVLAPGGGEIVIGRDTRISGPMLEGALVAGLCSAGVMVRTAGIVPSPAVAFLTIDERARAGGVISASHNPAPDNGIKFFSDAGIKISAGAEEEIEALMAEPPAARTEGTDVGVSEPLVGAVDRYVDHLLGSLEHSLSGLRVVVDCAFGAAWHVGPRAFREAGADVTAINAEADGSRINAGSGSTDLKGLAARVRSEGADLGIAFDGDADRALAVDENGAVIDGDRIIAMLALHMHEQETLDKNIVIATVMANLGFRRALSARGIEVIACPVGDKYVGEAMRDHGAVLGGEQSGHVIFGHHSTTGDGVLTGLKVAELVRTSDRPLSEMAEVFESYPQVLINVQVVKKERLDDARGLWDLVAEIEASLGDKGRILLRASGTEPLVRVMVEAADKRVARRVAEDLAGVVERELS